MIRDGSGGRRSLDDVMRALSTRFTASKGFTGIDLEHAVADACTCDAHQFFETYVRAAAALDFNRWLSVVGLRSAVTWTPARATDGSAAPDLRISAYIVAGEAYPRLQVWFPATAWGRAGLHTGDRLVSWNGVVVNDVRQFRAALEQLRIGDSVRVSVARNSGAFETTVAIVGYDRPVVTVEERPDATDAQRALRRRWMAGQ
jgi:predicted metalloprotease with PDZ domain